MANNEQSSSSKWSEIPSDILLSITKHLKIYSDYIHLRCICRNYHTILPPTPPQPLPTQLPWLLLPSTSFHYNFFNLLTNKTHSFHLPEASYPRRICGSSFGWLIIVGDTPNTLFCFNPITNVKLSLPPISSLPPVVSFSYSNVGREYSIRDPSNGLVYSLDLRQMRDSFVSKVVLSNGSPLIAVGIIRCHLTGNTQLVFCKIGNHTWDLVPVSNFSAEDVIYSEYDQLFYAVNKRGDVLVFGFDNDSVNTIIPSVSTIVGDLHYLVKSDGELLLVSRSLGAEADVIAYCEVYGTVGIDVYRFRDDEEGRVEWDKVNDLGDRMVFIGENSSLALLASDFPGCNGNRIYFTDDHSKLNDVGFFDLGSGCIEPLPCSPHDTTMPFQWAPPIWITPNPC